MTRGVLLFDFGGTLDADGLPASAQFHRAFTAEGIGVPAEHFAARFRAADRALLEWPGIHEADFSTMVFREAAWLAADLETTPPALADRVARRVVDGARRHARRNQEILTRLRETHRLGVISNFSGNLGPCLAELGLAPLFDVAADSGRLGITKPSLGIFEWALAQLDAAPDRTWMIGDNFDADLRPAAALGLTACWLAPAARPWPAVGVTDLRIASLTELPRMIEARCAV
jgi:putative hydrolase of the HAD superfamily